MSRTLRRLIPSPAMIVALVALVMSLGGSAYATLMNGGSSPPIPGESIQNNSVAGKEIRNNSVTGKDIRTRSLRGRDIHRNSVGSGAIQESALDAVPSASGLEFWAVVTDTGGLHRGAGVDSTEQTEPGIYQVMFNADVHGCSYQATIGDPLVALPDQDSQITVSALPDQDGNGVTIPNNVNGVHVRTADGENDPTPMAFQLAVIC